MAFEYILKVFLKTTCLSVGLSYDFQLPMPVGLNFTVNKTGMSTETRVSTKYNKNNVVLERIKLITTVCLSIYVCLCVCECVCM